MDAFLFEEKDTAKKKKKRMLWQQPFDFQIMYYLILHGVDIIPKNVI